MGVALLMPGTFYLQTAFDGPWFCATQPMQWYFRSGACVDELCCANVIVFIIVPISKNTARWPDIWEEIYKIEEILNFGRKFCML